MNENVLQAILDDFKARARDSVCDGMAARFIGRCEITHMPIEWILAAVDAFWEEMQSAPPEIDSRPSSAPPYGYEAMWQAALVDAGLTASRWQTFARKMRKRYGRCCYCGYTGPKLVVDHDMPITRGGTFELANLVVACSSCNSRKKGLTGAEYLEKLAGLQ